MAALNLNNHSDQQNSKLSRSGLDEEYRAKAPVFLKKNIVAKNAHTAEMDNCNVEAFTVNLDSKF